MKRLDVFQNSLKQLPKGEKYAVGKILGASIFPHSDHIEDAFNVIKPYVTAAFTVSYPEEVIVDVDEKKMFDIKEENIIDD